MITTIYLLSFNIITASLSKTWKKTVAALPSGGQGGPQRVLLKIVYFEGKFWNKIRFRFFKAPPLTKKF